MSGPRTGRAARSGRGRGAHHRPDSRAEEADWFTM